MASRKITVKRSSEFRLHEKIELDAAEDLRTSLIAWFEKSKPDDELRLIIENPTCHIALQLAAAACASAARKSTKLALEPDVFAASM